MALQKSAMSAKQITEMTDAAASHTKNRQPAVNYMLAAG